MSSSPALARVRAAALAEVRRRHLLAQLSADQREAL